MRIHLSYFAALRENAGKSEEQVETSVATAGALYAELDARYGFKLPLFRMKVAINDALVPPDCLLQTGDHVVFIAPVAGG